jgi:hypothetical protein
MFHEIKIMLLTEECFCCNKTTTNTTECSICTHKFCRDDIRVTPGAGGLYAICRYCARHILREWGGQEP